MTGNQSKSDRRIWLDWRQPALPAAVEWMLQKYLRGREWDLSGVILVTPGVRSRHRVLELVVARAERDRLDLTPPEFVPLGQLPERLYVARHRFAGDVVQHGAWARALRSVGGEKLGVLVRRLPESDDLTAWLPLARLMYELHADLASEALDFSDVYQELSRRSAHRSELERWQILQQLQRHYYDQLKIEGLWDRQAARIEALKRDECRADKDLVLLGLADVGRVFRQMVAKVNQRIYSLVVASDEAHDGFDELGFLDCEYWLNWPIKLQPEQIRTVDRPADQANAVIECLHQLQSQFSAAQITIGIPDRSVLSHLRRALELAGVAARDAAGKPMAQTLPVSLVQATIDYLRQQHYRQFSRLIRHPDCFEWISARIKNRVWLQLVNGYQNAFIPTEFTLREGFHLSQDPILRSVHQAVSDLLRPLIGSARRLSQWSQAWTDFLLEIYGEQVVDHETTRGREMLAGCQSLQASLRTLAELPDAWSLQGSAGDAMEVVLGQIQGETLGEPAQPNAIELSGWLDLPLDDARAVVVTGFNEGTVPSSQSTHLFLPNSLRESLGLADNARRFARDAYALSVLTRSERSMKLICGRRSDQGDPLLPSRLLFLTDDTTVAERASAFFQHRADPRTRIWLASETALPPNQQFEIPRPKVAELNITSLRVTDFKQYLQCRYRFYLDRILQLKESVDNLSELPPYAFGHLLHNVVEAFGNDPLKDSTNPEEIRRFFRRRLDIEMERYGEHPPATIRIQHQQVRLRLDRLADLQAAWRDQGWEIVEAEVAEGRATLVVDGEPFLVRGRIDRVDRHAKTGALAVFDYKTSDAATPPDKAHRKNGQWIDLQLPLYRHLIAARDYFSGGAIKLGYILAPGDVKKTQFAMAEWSADELLNADAVACDVIRAVRQKQFWPPAAEPPEYGELWAGICQDQIPERWSLEEKRA